MGEVYLARDTRLERKVALKVLPPELAANPERLRRLIREAKALAALDHAHIVTVFSVEEDEGVHFLTMAYVEGSSLDSLIPSGGLPVEDLLHFAVPLTDALRAAHERGIIHRDLKPANVMVDIEGRLRVLDFGLAKRGVGPSDELTRLTTQGLTGQMTREGAILGTYPYMSPEQAEGRPVDARSDLFSLGTMLYEMACGVRPFGGDTGIALITAILRDEPVKLAARRPDLPQRLVEIIERCLEKDPERRYPSAIELRQELEEVRREVRRGEAAPAILTTTVGTDEISPQPTATRRSMVRGALVSVAVVVALLAGTWAWQGRRESNEVVAVSEEATPDIDSLVVLPLRNLTGDPGQEFFVDGMTEALITDLSKIGALKVISRSSAMRYRGTDKTISEIASELAVDAVVEGSVMREGDRVVISAQLIRADSEENLWAERYDRDVTSILSLQGEIAQAIAAEIQVTLTPAEEGLLTASRVVNPAAHEAYLKGMFHLQKFTPQDFELALRYFETAVEIDPDYALAHSGVASAWIYKNQLGVAPPSEAMPMVQPALAKALELDPLLAEAHLAQAQVHEVWDWDWEAAEASYQRALELNPNSAEGHIFYSHFASQMGRGEEGTAAALRALELDPLNPFFQGLYGIQLTLTGRLDEGIAQIRRAHQMAPGFDFARQPLSYVLGRAGRKEESYEELRTHYSLVGDDEILEAMGEAKVDAGYEAAMHAVADILAGRSETTWVHAFDVFSLYDLARDTERALAWLETGYEVRDPDMPYLGVLWLSQEVRSDPRFLSLMQRMNFPELVIDRIPSS